MKTGALYIRVSTHMQDELSPDAQRRLLLDYAKTNHIVISENYIFLENGVSGRKADKRPEFQKMIGLAKSKPAPFETILVWKFSRFARNQEESIVYKSLLRKQCNIDVISISEPMIDGPFGSLIERIIEWMDEYYSTRLSGEVTRGMTEKALRGGYQARPPLGYRIVEKGKPPVVVPEEAKIVRMIFEKYVTEHMSFFDIARYLNTFGFQTSHGKSFEGRSIDYIIQNPTYCGYIRWNRSTNETNEIKNRSEWIVAKGQHEPLISEELFDAAQKLYKDTYRPKGARPSSTYKHWLSGLLKCSECGRTMIAKTVLKKETNKPYVYFSCYGYCKGKCLVSNSVSSLKLEPVFLKALQTVLDTKNIDFEYKEAVKVESVNERKILEDQLSGIELKVARIKEAYRNGIDTLDEYKSNKDILANERNLLLLKLKEIIPETAKKNNDKEEMLKKVSNIYHIVLSNEFSDIQKNEALKSMIEKIVYNRLEDSLKIYYYIANP